MTIIECLVAHNKSSTNYVAILLTDLII